MAAAKVAAAEMVAALGGAAAAVMAAVEARGGNRHADRSGLLAGTNPQIWKI